MEGNEGGIELRAVQIWFQDNYNGISDKNIRWLARIFGCDDPEATSEWQAELRAAKCRLTKERRERRKKRSVSVSSREDSATPRPTLAIEEISPLELASQGGVGPSYAAPVSAMATVRGTRTDFNIARKTEAMFSSEGSLTLPLAVFTGACALALIAFTLNIHSILYAQNDGPARQVGFLWAPNWTIVFFALLPLFLAILIELKNRWHEDWRAQLVSYGSSKSRVRSWDRGLTKASFSFWVTFIVTVVVASGYNWSATHLLPLLKGDPGGWPIDWGRIAIVRPDQISIPAAISFSGLVFLFNGLTAYLFFAGHIFLHLMKSDFALVMRDIEAANARIPAKSIEIIGFQLMYGIFRCTAIGIAITIMMKLQSAFLQSGTTNILAWLWSDLRAVFGGVQDISVKPDARSAPPGFIYSFLCVLAIGGTFISAQLRIRLEMNRVLRIKCKKWWGPWTSMNICMTLLVGSYFATGFIPGFTALVLLSLLTTVYLVSMPAEREVVAVA